MTTQYRLTVVSRITGTPTTKVFKKPDAAFTQFQSCMEAAQDYAFICMSEAWKGDYGAWYMGRILHVHVGAGALVAMDQSAQERRSVL